jgi:hypothetical protein
MKVHGVLPYVAPEESNFRKALFMLLVLHVYKMYTGWTMPSIIPNHFFLHFNIRNALPIAR